MESRIAKELKSMQKKNGRNRGNFQPNLIRNEGLNLIFFKLRLFSNAKHEIFYNGQ